MGTWYVLVCITRYKSASQKALKYYVSYSNRALATTSSSNGALGEGSEGWGRFLGVIGSSQARQAPSPSPLGARGVCLDYSHMVAKLKLKGIDGSPLAPQGGGGGGPSSL